MSEEARKSPENVAVPMVTMFIDGKEVRVPKGTNIVLAAASAGVDIPHYCYHPHLSIAGNCRMCQIEIEGQPKLAIGCNTTAAEGLRIKTHFSSPAVEESQRATLEFLLINHPLDCTVCDQAGHCKLQDYHYEYNGKGSRFIEDKVNKVKAEVLGPEVIYDGERCIMCTRCVRFCAEVTETSELGAFNRGDRGVIGVFPEKQLDNALSGTVVDLCPVGALTHRKWRFNTRMWYTGMVDTVCAGCSTGCSAKVAVRDDSIVQVKARLNSAVNKEWMCDEGRYGFMRFQPSDRLTAPLMRQGAGSANSTANASAEKESDGFQEVSWQQAQLEAARLKGSPGSTDAAVFLSPFLTLEEMWLAIRFAETVMGVSGNIALQLYVRSLRKEELVLVSPDYAPNARAFTLLRGADDADWRQGIASGYQRLLHSVRSGAMKRILIVGNMAVLDADVDAALVSALQTADVSVAITPRAVGGGQSGGVHENCRVLFPGRTVNEKSGVMVNKDARLQRMQQLLSGPFGSVADWLALQRIAAGAGKPILGADVIDERGLFREMVKAVPKFSGLTLMKLGELGITLEELSLESGSSNNAQGMTP